MTVRVGLRTIVVAVSLAALAIPAGARAADGKLVSECIRKVASSSLVMGRNAEIIGVIACAGFSPSGGEPDAREFDEKVRRISKCISNVSFRSDVRGDAADAIGAMACVGVVDPEETQNCLSEVERSFSIAKGDVAEILAARACANGNPAKETAACVRYVAFRLDANGLDAETLAVQACSK
jgi:hypothetical protein